MDLFTYVPKIIEPWNKRKIIGQQPPLKLQEIWTIRIHLQQLKNPRDLALFNLAILIIFDKFIVL